jgi:hypothetical protein
MFAYESVTFPDIHSFRIIMNRKRPEGLVRQRRRRNKKKMRKALV